MVCIVDPGSQTSRLVGSSCSQKSRSPALDSPDPTQLASGQTNKSTTFLRRFQKSAGSGNWEELYGFLPCFAEPAFAAAVVVVFTGVRFLPVVHQWLAAMG